MSNEDLVRVEGRQRLAAQQYTVTRTDLVSSYSVTRTR